MSPEAWNAFLTVAIDELIRLAYILGAGAWLGWNLRGRSDARKAREHSS